ncbi:MAG: hypothetical protein HZA93_00715 [Verrucomicrobia bacterium]|nr:hypothetical protein [Verrucomicrobiota bacterium]
MLLQPEARPAPPSPSPCENPAAFVPSRAPYNWRTCSNAPNRLWGFNELFNQGRFPPLTPRVMSYRRVDFNDLDRTTYNAVKASWGL